MDEGAYQCEAEILDVVQKFEACAYRPEEFSHVRHLTVASWYLEMYGAAEGLRKMREGLQRFLVHHGKKMGYHETITRFWMKLLGETLRQIPERPSHERINEAVALFGDKDVLFTYYSRELVMSDAARNQWLEPDLRTIDISA